MISKFKEAKRVGEPGFLKEGKNRVQESASKRVLVSKAKVKIEEAQGASVRKHTPDKMTKSAGRSNACHTESLGQAQEYQRPLAFTDSHFSSYSGTSTPNILPHPSRQGMDGALSYPVPMGSFLQGSLTEEGNQKYIQVCEQVVIYRFSLIEKYSPGPRHHDSHLLRILQTEPGFPDQHAAGPDDAGNSHWVHPSLCRRSRQRILIQNAGPRK